MTDTAALVQSPDRAGRAARGQARVSRTHHRVRPGRRRRQRRQGRRTVGRGRRVRRGHPQHERARGDHGDGPHQPHQAIHQERLRPPARPGQHRGRRRHGRRHVPLAAADCATRTEDSFRVLARDREPLRLEEIDGTWQIPRRTSCACSTAAPRPPELLGAPAADLPYPTRPASLIARRAVSSSGRTLLGDGFESCLRPTVIGLTRRRADDLRAHEECARHLVTGDLGRQWAITSSSSRSSTPRGRR